MARMMEAACEPRSVRHSQGGVVLGDTTQPDHVADSCRYLLMAIHDRRYSFQSCGTDFRVW